jgi:hypothetical protein
VEQELQTLSERLSSSLISSGVRIAQSQVLCVVFCRSLFVLLSLSYCIVCLSICGLTTLCYLQTILS